MVLGFDCNAGWLDINTSKTFMDVSASGTMAELTINGYHFDITGTTVNVLPNMSSNNSQVSSIASGYDFQIPSPFEMGFSIKDVSGTIEPTLLKSFTGNTYLVCRAVVYAFNYLYVYCYNDPPLGQTSICRLYRISIIDGSTESITLEPVSGTYRAYGQPGLIVTDINTAYGMVYDATDVGYLVLAKFDFCASDVEIIWSFPDPPGMYGSFTYNGDEHSIDGAEALTKVEYEGNTYLVGQWRVINWDADPNTCRLWLFIYDINADDFTLIENVRYNSTYELYHNSSFGTAPLVYKDKVVFSVDIDDWAVVPDPLPSTICVFPVFIVDCTSKTIKRVETGYLPDPSTEWPTTLRDWGSYIDYSTGEFYIWLEDWLFGSYYGTMLKLDLDDVSPTFSLVAHKATLGASLIQGRTSGVGISYELGTSDNYVLKMPGITKLSLLSSTRVGWSRVADEENNKLWIFCSDGNIRGYSMTTSSTATVISVNWSGGDPFTYDYSQYAQIYLCSGNILLAVRSRENPTSGFWQSDFYVLREDISCL